MKVQVPGAHPFKVIPTVTVTFVQIMLFLSKNARSYAVPPN